MPVNQKKSIELKWRIAKLKAKNFKKAAVKIDGFGNEFYMPEGYSGLHGFEVEGENNLVCAPAAKITSTLFKIKGSGNKIVIREGSEVFESIFLLNGSNIYVEIGRNCRIKFVVRTYGGDCRLIIKKKTALEQADFFLFSESAITVGEHCMFSTGIELRNGDGHKIIDLASEQKINHPKNITIGNHVWLGHNVKVLKGVTIGDGSIVGLGSVCTKSLPQNCIAAGVPAVVKKTNVMWDQIY